MRALQYSSSARICRFSLSQVGTFSGTPQNTDYILASSEDDSEVANLFNRSTKFNMAVNDDNTISVFLDFGYSNTSTYTFEKTNQPAEAMMPYCGSWGDAKGTQLGFTYSESKNMTEFSTIFGFSPDQYPVGIPSVTDDNECWICCPFKKSVLTSFSDQGVYYDVINIHMEFNSDGTVNVGRVYTNPNLINSGISNTGLVLQKNYLTNEKTCRTLRTVLIQKFLHLISRETLLKKGSLNGAVPSVLGGISPPRGNPRTPFPKTLSNFSP